MDTRLNDTQQELFASAMGVLEKHAPLESIDAVTASAGGYDSDLYALFAELGWTWLGWDQEDESTLVELGLIVNRLGYFGVPSPFRTTMSAAWLASLATGGQSPVLERVSAGEIVAVVDATRGGDREVLSEWADAAATLIVATTDGEHVVVRAVEATQAHRTTVDVFDGERTASVRGVSTQGDELGRLDADAWARWRAVDRLLRSADILGAAQRSLDMTVENAKNRHQFGRPIGTFQALQHQAANMRMDIEATALLTWSGLWRAASGEPFVRQSLMAAWQAAESGERVSKTSVQLHGGIGFIREYPLHHFYCRTKAQRLRFGAHRTLVRELGDAVLDAAKTEGFREQFVDWPASG